MIARRKSRYVLVEASRDIDMEAKEPQLELAREIAMEIGNLGYSHASPKVMGRAGSNSFIIRVARGHEGTLAMALAFIKELGGRPIGLYTIRTSGTILSLRPKSAKD